MDIENLSDRQRHALRLWESGLTSIKIAVDMGITRSAVMGIIGRLRLKGLVTRRHDVDRAVKAFDEAVTGALPDRRYGQRRKGAFHKPKDLSPRITLPHFSRDKDRKPGREVVFAKKRGDEVGIMELTRFKCRYINGEIDGFNTVYCGKHVTRGVYCADHAALCYYTPPDRAGASNANNASAKPPIAG